jgi:hypothetical protein
VRPREWCGAKGSLLPGGLDNLVTCDCQRLESVEARTRTAAIRVGSLSSWALCGADAGLWRIASRWYDAETPSSAPSGAKAV